MLLVLALFPGAELSWKRWLWQGLLSRSYLTLKNQKLLWSLSASCWQRVAINRSKLKSLVNNIIIDNLINLLRISLLNIENKRSMNNINIYSLITRITKRCFAFGHIKVMDRYRFHLFRIMSSNSGFHAAKNTIVQCLRSRQTRTRIRPTNKFLSSSLCHVAPRRKRLPDAERWVRTVSYHRLP